MAMVFLSGLCEDSVGYLHTDLSGYVTEGSGLHTCEFGCLCGVMGTARLQEGELIRFMGNSFPQLPCQHL